MLDGAKAWFGANDVRWFVGDQLCHLAVTAVLAWCLPAGGLAPAWPGPVYPVLAVLAGAVAVVWGGRHLVGLAVAGIEVAPKGGLPDAGRTIGQLERALILVLVLVGQPEGIGFLVAAKSVFRFGKSDDERGVSGYVIIGTLWSFGYAMVIAFATAALVARLTESGVLTPGG